jgi:hypothetical protein
MTLPVQNTIDARLDVVEGKSLKGLRYFLSTVPELVQSEERFTEVRAGLKPLNKMDFDKLIACVRCEKWLSFYDSSFRAARFIRNKTKQHCQACGGACLPDA